MNIELLASDIASRIPEMARDSALNNSETIKGIIRQHNPPQDDVIQLLQEIKQYCVLLFWILIIWISIQSIF